jgi:hypothetical protein
MSELCIKSALHLAKIPDPSGFILSTPSASSSEDGSSPAPSAEIDAEVSSLRNAAEIKDVLCDHKRLDPQKATDMKQISQVRYFINIKKV